MVSRRRTILRLLQPVAQIYGEPVVDLPRRILYIPLDALRRFGSLEASGLDLLLQFRSGARIPERAGYSDGAYYCAVHGIYRPDAA